MTCWAVCSFFFEDSTQNHNMPPTLSHSPEKTIYDAYLCLMDLKQGANYRDKDSHTQHRNFGTGNLLSRWGLILKHISTTGASSKDRKINMQETNKPKMNILMWLECNMINGHTNKRTIFHICGGRCEDAWTRMYESVQVKIIKKLLDFRVGVQFFL